MNNELTNISHCTKCRLVFHINKLNKDNLCVDCQLMKEIEEEPKDVPYVEQRDNPFIGKNPIKRNKKIKRIKIV